MPVDAFILFVPASTSMMKVKGESQDAFFGEKPVEGNYWFEIKDFSFGIENKATIGSATAGAGGGKVQFNEFTIKKVVDTCSAAFFKNCCAGAHYKQVHIACRKAGTDGGSSGGPYLVFSFGTVFATKVDWSGPGDEGTEESITFAYGQMKISYKHQAADGAVSTSPAQVVEWDQVLNKGAFTTSLPFTF